MINPKLFKEDIEKLKEDFNKRGYTFDFLKYESLSSLVKNLKIESEKKRQRLNELSDLVGKAKRNKEEVSSEILFEIQETKKSISSLEKELKPLQENLDFLFLSIPNIPHSSVPVGNNETDNVIVRQWGTPRQFDFEFDHHLDLGLLHEGIYPGVGVTLTGSRFTVLYKHIARLHRALVQFMLDYNVRNGYDEVYVPYIVNGTSLISTGQLPKFEEDLFKLQGDKNYYLIPTAEVPLTNMIREKRFNSEDLPLKFTAHTPCFRSEAGSYGKDTKGLMRQHQFDKVEIVRVEEPSKSMEALEEMVSEVEGILQALELPYRVVELCTGDLGFSSAKTYDIEVWVPNEDKYREISSISNCLDFQSRRMDVRFNIDKTSNKDKQYVHTLNGSALAVGRTLLALLENHQTQLGHIHIPKALRPYFDNIDELDLA